MHRLKNKFPAFTIMELMVVSVLTAILVGGAMTAFQLIDQQFRNYHRQSSASLDYSALHALMQEDISEAIQLEVFGGEELLLTGRDYDLQYHFESGRIIRQALLPEVRPDTFALQLKQVHYAFRGQKQYEGPVDHIQYELQDGLFTYPFTFHKHYSAADLIKLSYGH